MSEHEDAVPADNGEIMRCRLDEMLDRPVVWSFSCGGLSGFGGASCSTWLSDLAYWDSLMSSGMVFNLRRTRWSGGDLKIAILLDSAFEILGRKRRLL